MWGVPKPPIVVHLDAFRVTVRTGSGNSAPTHVAVQGVEVQQEYGCLMKVSDDQSIEFGRVAPIEKLRLRWLLAGVGGPWSEWMLVVRNTYFDLYFVFVQSVLVTCMCSIFFAKH
jgi:hypothetical protein